VATASLLHLPVTPAADPDRLLAELSAAVDLVAGGTAARVIVVNVAGLESVAAVACARAHARDVSFALVRDANGVLARAVVGPRRR